MAISVLVLMVACDKTGATDENFRKVQLDMTESQVIEILGSPDRAFTHPQNASLRMLEWHEDSRVVLDNGIVHTVVLHEKTILEKPEE